MRKRAGPMAGNSWRSDQRGSLFYSSAGSHRLGHRWGRNSHRHACYLPDKFRNRREIAYLVLNKRPVVPSRNLKKLLRLFCLDKEPASMADRHNAVICRVNEELRHVHPIDDGNRFITVFRHERDRQERIELPPPVDKRRERAIEYHTSRICRRGKLDRHRGSERASEYYDVVGRNPELVPKVFIGGIGVERESLLARIAVTQTIAAIVKSKDANARLMHKRVEA